MSINEWRDALLAYFFTNKNTSYLTRTIKDNDYLLLLKGTATADTYDILITIGELVAKINEESGSNQFNYLLLNNVNPESIDNPTSPFLAYGQYNNKLWIKDSSGNIDYLVSDVLQIVASVDGTTVFDFTPNIIPQNSAIFINGSIIKTGYSINGTQVITTVAQDKYTVMNVHRTITRNI